MPKVFISYRHSDSQEVAGRIYDWLVSRFGGEHIFKDVYNMEPGAKFAAQIHTELAKANVTLVIIGPTWLTATDLNTGARRLDDPNDWVRLEVELALASGMTVIPVVVLNARTPVEYDLPPSMQKLVSHHATQVRPDPDFPHDMARLLAVLNRLDTRRSVASYIFALIFLGAFTALMWGAWSAGKGCRPDPTPPPGESDKKADFENLIPGQKPPRLACAKGVDAETAQAAQRAWAAASRSKVTKKVDLDDAQTTMAFACIPPGVFLMGEGNTKEAKVDECIYMGTHEVTQKQWRALTGANHPAFDGDDDRPVEQVSWKECKDFCVKLSKRLTGETARLPTEAEWEYCCRAGTITSYSFGDIKDALGEHGWYSANSDGRTQKVGKRPANAWGLHDMHGNAWEWCEDPWKQGADIRILRGGSWANKAEECSAAFRNKGAANKGHAATGFRVVISIAKPPPG